MDNNTQTSQLNRKTTLTVVASLIGLVVVSRLIPHPWNMTAVGSASLFAGFMFSKQSRIWALIVGVLGLLITDAILGFHTGMIYTYFAVIFAGLLGEILGRQSWPRLNRWFGGSIVSSTFFFVVSNFGVWMHSGMYTKDWNGFVQCYALAIPFYRFQVLGDLIYLGAILIIALVYRVPQFRTQSSSAVQ